MIDMLFRMVMYALLILGAIGLFFQVKAIWNEQEATVTLNQLIGAVDNTFVRRDYTDGQNLIPTLQTFNTLPDGLVNSDGTTLTHSFGGPITIVGNGNGYSIAYGELDSGTCASLAVKYSGNNKARSGLNSITINGDELSGEISTAAVGGACDQEGDANTITWNFF